MTMPHPRRGGEAAQRQIERRQREDEANRLAAEVPNLASLSIEIAERRAGSPIADAKHTRRVVVATAPALFELLCGDRDCKHGGHDLTRPIMAALKEGKERLESEDPCHGSVGSANCARVLEYLVIATYADGRGSSDAR
jgi:hypothetical protein